MADQEADRPPGEHFVEPSRVDPASDQTSADSGTKLFVVFFMLVVPPLGLAILVGVCWTLWKVVMSNA